MNPFTFTYMSGAADGNFVSIPVAIHNASVTIGRHPECTVCIDKDPDASRRHAQVCFRSGDWWLEDLGSANGTFIGEFSSARRITTSMKLQPGQIFRIGLTRFRFDNEDPQLANHEMATRLSVIDVN